MPVRELRHGCDSRRQHVWPLDMGLRPATLRSTLKLMSYYSNSTRTSTSPCGVVRCSAVRFPALLLPLACLPAYLATAASSVLLLFVHWPIKPFPDFWPDMLCLEFSFPSD